MATKIDSERKKEMAYLYFMSGMTHKEIMSRTGVKSNKTITSWVQDGGWKEKRAAKTISRPELVSKALLKINEKLDSDDWSADELSKLAALIEKLDKQDSPITAMGVFIGFGKFLSNISADDREVDVEFIKKVNKYQDAFISHKMNRNE